MPVSSTTQILKKKKFLIRHNLPKLTQDRDNLSSPISVKQIEFVVKHVPTTKIPGSDGFTTEFETLKEIIPILHKFFQETK